MELLLLSGGLDSSALACLRRPDICLTIDYGQSSARGELHSARTVAARLGLRWESLTIDCLSIGSGELAGEPSISASPSPEWWPYRNQLLVTLAAAWGLRNDVSTVIVGSVKSDAFHVDGSHVFYEKLNELVRMQEGDVSVRVPAIDKRTAELLRESGLSRGVAAWTHSCHTGSLACGACRGCFKRSEVLGEMGWL